VPSRQPNLTTDDVHRHVRDHCLAAGAGGRLGVELEWLTCPAEQPSAPLSFADLTAATATVAPLPCGGRVTFEPGGQVELSSPPHQGIAAAHAAVARDSAVLRDALAAGGIGVLASGVDPLRHRRRVVRGARYDAMEGYFDAQGRAGRMMMCDTASVQVNVDLGGTGSARSRWVLAHAIGPTLAAAFANSPIVAGQRTRYRSARLGVWAAIDHTRTAPACGAGGAFDTGDAWTRYALDARVMLVRVSDERYQPLVEHLSFGEWIAHGHELGWPTEDDFVYHLTTLFPPVRLRGWLELRMVDALPDTWWRVPGAIVTALLDDEEAAEEATIATRETAGHWRDAARHGLSHPGLAVSARRCFAVALDALSRVGADDETRAACAEYVDRFVARDRCPADDVLEGVVESVIDRREPAWI
jgi:glutamate--cysteine ligase